MVRALAREPAGHYLHGRKTVCLGPEAKPSPEPMTTHHSAEGVSFGAIGARRVRLPALDGELEQLNRG